MYDGKNHSEQEDRRLIQVSFKAVLRPNYEPIKCNN